MNTNNTEVREYVIRRVNELLKEQVPRGVKDLDFFSSPVWQYMPVLMEAIFVISKQKKKFDVLDLGKNIIISNQHTIASGYVETIKDEDDEEAEVECEAGNQDILYQMEQTPMFRTERFVHQKIFMTWTPAWQRYNYLMWQLRKQDGKTLVSRFQEMVNRDDINEDCRVIENRDASEGFGGKTWETKCLLAKPVLTWMGEEAKKADKNDDGEISFHEHLAFGNLIGEVFLPTAPAYTPTSDGSVRHAFIADVQEDYAEDNFEDLLGISADTD